MKIKVKDDIFVDGKLIKKGKVADAHKRDAEELIKRGLADSAEKEEDVKVEASR